MSLKSIDAQLSLSRSKDVGILQNQLIHKPSDDQAALAAQAFKRAEAERKKSGQVDNRSSHNGINDQSSQERQEQPYSNRSNRARKAEEEGNSNEHPYKGHRIDISL